LDGDRTVVVAVLAVRVVEVIADQVVDMIAVGHLLVPARRAMPVRGLVLAAVVLRGAADGVGVVDLQDVLVDVIAVRMVQVSVMQVVDVTVVLHGGMPAGGTVLMGMAGVGVVLGFAHERHRRPAPTPVPSGWG
jgi:hypothetical protein